MTTYTFDVATQAALDALAQRVAALELGARPPPTPIPDPLPVPTLPGPVASVTLAPATAALVVGDTLVVTLMVRDALGTVLTEKVVGWNCSNFAVASMSAIPGTFVAKGAGTAIITATVDGVSGSMSLTVAASAIVPVPGPTPTGVLLSHAWDTALGNSEAALRDANGFHPWDFHEDGGLGILTVVPGGPPGFANALRVQQRGGGSGWANLRAVNVVPLSTDFEAKFWIKNEDTGAAGDHVVVTDVYGWQSMTFMRKWSDATGWRMGINCWSAYQYPVSHWGPNFKFTHGQWYKFVYRVHFVDATHVQLDVQVFAVAGLRILSAADFRQEDFGAALYLGRSDWTLASFAAAGQSLSVDPVKMSKFAVGNNGQSGSTDTGLFWYIAGVEVNA
jgi:hypothetical protein